ncbi:protein piccolo [Bactrocera tryoni]|uniref:protein piccolo n=1 Tax=Bactrocera tryoni TaxID=59916 RepID=UPI001A969726|nr:protein piccolo [Bactrocera tryoni]
MASSMIAAAAVAASTSASSAATGEMKREEEEDDGCNEEGEEEAFNTTLRSCANDPDFAVICAFLQKFAKDLGIPLPNFKHLQEWLTNTDEVIDQLRDLHIKLLRKTRKTVHEKSWESALSKFCFSYSAQDAWEVERFGYKKSSLKVKLRIFRELLESQFQRNGKFRAQILTMSADSLRSQPIGRDRLGHTYYFTQDSDGNLRVYQEHLDEEIWQVVATTREELVNLISRLRGNEVVLPSTDIGVDEDTSSSNSCTAQVEKPPPPEEQDDSQEEEARIPNLRIKLSNNGKLAVSSPNTTTQITSQAAKRCLDDVEKSSPRSEELNIIKKARPSLLDVNRAKKPSRYENTISEEEEEGEEGDEDEDDVDEEELSIEEEDIDSAAAEEDENEEKEIEDSDGDSDEELNDVGEAIEEPTLIVSGEGAGEDCEGVYTNKQFSLNTIFFGDYDEVCEVPYTDPIVGEVVEEATFYVHGEGTGAECLVGNGKNDVETAAATTTTTTPTTPTKTNEPKATFFFGEPGCLKLSPMKQQQAKDEGNNMDGDDGGNSQVVDKASEIFKNATNEKDEECVEAEKDAEKKLKETSDLVLAKEKSEQANNIDLKKEGDLDLKKEGALDIKKEKDLDSKNEGEISSKDKEAHENKDLEEKVTANGGDVESGTNPVEKDKSGELKNCAKIFEEEVNERKENVTNNDDSKSSDESVEKLSVSKGEHTENSLNDNKAEDQNKADTENGVEAAGKQQTLEENNLTEKPDVNRDVKVKPSEELIQSETTITTSVNEPKAPEILSNDEDNDIILPKSTKTAQDIEIEKTEENPVTEQVDTKVNANTELTIENKSCKPKETFEIEPIKIEKPPHELLAEPVTKSNEHTEEKTLPIINNSSESSKTDLKNVKPSTLTVTQSVSNEVTNAVSVTNIVSVTNTCASTTAAATPPTIINRKRRLEDMPAPATHRLSTSESEVDIHSEQPEELATEDDLDPADVGGKRIKMRPKITNADLRKKVEAQKGRVEETTSSSGEEEARRRRKIITPRRQIERCVKNLKVAQEAAAKRECSQAQAAKQTETTISATEEKTVALNLTSPTTTLAFPPAFPAVATTVLPLVSAAKPLVPSMSSPAPTLPLTPVHATPTTTTGRQKPTLAEIIEKKLKKSSEKAAPTPPTVKVETLHTTKAATTIVVTATTTNANDADSPLATFSPPKKSPITKPLKKNLLTQLRQEESDEDSIPRKRTISDAGATAAAIETAANKLETHSSEDKDPTPERKTLERKTPERKTPERKVNESLFAERASVPRKTPDRKTPERQRKRRSSEEVKVTGAKESESNKEMKYETLVEHETKTTEVVVKKEKSPSPVAEVTTFGRRSSRRSAATVIYAELPQPKRTRGGAKATTPVATPKKTNIKEDKKSESKETVKAVAEPVTAEDAKKDTAMENIITETITTTTSKETAKKAAASTPTAKESSKESKAKAKPKPKASKATKKDAKKETANSVHEEPKSKPEKKLATTNASSVKNASTPATSTTATLEKAEKTPLVKSTPTPSPTKITTPEKNATESTPAGARGRGPRKQREVDATNIIDTIDSETPVRQSRRIAQQKIREEAERRKLEEIALRTMKQELKKKKKAEKQTDPTVVEPSEPSSSEESEVELKKKAKKKCPGKDGWSSGSEEQEEPEEEDEPPQYSDPGSPLFRSDHEFSPESDLEDETQVVPMKRARTARKEDAEEGEDGDEEACQKCGKSDHPEWILLCDNCDKGYHCSCLSPVLFYIPEGDWYCPPCQQEQLIAALEKQLNDFDEFVELKRLQEVENKRLAAEAERAEQERLENEKQQQKELKERKKQKKKSKRRGENGKEGEDDEDESGSSGSSDDGKSDERNKKRSASDDDSDDDKPLVKKGTSSRKSRTENYRDSHKRRRGDGRSRRRAAARGIASRRRQRNDSDSGTGSGSHRSGSDSGGSRSGTGSSSSSSLTDSDDEPIYKLRKRRQINVSYRLNEYDDLINSALKKEMDELAGAGNLGRGKDISTIMEADKEEKARQRQLEKDETTVKDEKDAIKTEEQDTENENEKDKEKETKEDGKTKSDDGDDSDEVLKRKAKPKGSIKKKPRKLTTLDISSEEDNASDEDFKTSSFDDDEEEDTSISVSTDSDSSLEVFRRRGKKNKKQRKAARRAIRERRKDRRFVVDESDDDEEEEDRPKSKKKKSDDWDCSESETDSEASENLEDVDSADLCDDTTSESDGAWYPSKRKKQRKGNSSNVARKSPKLKKQPVKKVKRVEYSDDDISESEEEEEEDDDDITGGKGSGKQPRSQPLKSSNSSKGKGKGKGKGKTTASKKKKKQSENEDSFSDSEDSTRRTRGRRYAYLEDFDDESSDGGIKPGVKRPDTPPEERQKFIQRQEEIKRMLAEKNAEGAKLAATPRLTPIKADGEKDKRSPAKLSDSLSTVPLSVIRQAKALDAEYLQRKGESVGDSDNVDEVDEFDDADLPDDFPEDMDEDTIARMVEEEEELSAAAAARDLPPADEVLRTPTKQTNKSKETPAVSTAPPAVAPTPPANLPSNTSSVVVTNTPGGLEKTSLINPALAALAQMPGASSAAGAHHMSSSPLASGLQEPMRKRLPMPTLHPPLLRHQFPPHGTNMPLAHLLQRHPSAQPPTHLLQSALNAPLGQPLNRSSFPPQHLPRLPAGMTVEQMLAAQHLMSAAAARHNLPPTTQPLPGASATREALLATSGSAGSGPPAGGASASSVPPSAPTAGVNKAETEPKPRGRRKKITPLRDTLQKQQTAAAVTAATTQSDKASESPASNGAGGSVIKSALSASANAPPPQLYKQQEGPNVSGAPTVSQASVITRMPQLPAAAAHASVVRAMSNLYPGADVARFFAPPTSLAAVTGARPPPSMSRHRDGPGMPGLPPHGMRQSYGPPPPLRGSVSSLANHGPPPQGSAGERPTYPAPGDHHVPGGMGASMYGGPPPPARHSTSHLNPYRPPIYGNPSFVPRGPHVPNLRVPVSGAPEFASGPRAYSPYGYYPPPPPLTTPHGPPMQRPPTSTPAPTSRGGGGPPPTTAATISAPPVPPTIVSAASAITTTPIATTKPSVPASAITTTIAKPSSVIVAAPPSSASANLNKSNIVQKSPSRPTPTIIQAPTSTPIQPTTTTPQTTTPVAIPTRAIVTEAAVSAPIATIVNSKGPIVTATVTAAAAPAVVSEPQAPPRKKLTTLETYAVAHTKSPLVIAGESSGSRSSPGGIQAEAADDSSSAQGTTTAAVVADSGEGQASEFSGLVSYFSSQHDDYNT